MFAFVAKHRGIWSVSWICEALGVSRSAFYGWLTRPPPIVKLAGERITDQSRKG